VEALEGERKYSCYSFLTSALDGVSITSRERTPGTHWIGGWVGLRAGLDTEVREEKYFASAGDRTPVVFLILVVHFMTLSQ
jgi:hypothetical protein